MSLSLIHTIPPVYLNEPLRLQSRYNNDPFIAKWERLCPGNIGASAIAFDPRGSFLAIGTNAGQVSTP